MGGTRIFLVMGAARGQGGRHRGKRNYCHRTFNWWKL